MVLKQSNIISAAKPMGKASTMRKEVWNIDVQMKTFSFLIYITFNFLIVIGGDKTDASSASVHGKTIDTAYDLYLYLKEHHSTVSHTYHEALHQIDKREYHYFPRGTFLSYHPRIPKKLSAVKPYYTFAVKRSEQLEKILYQRKHYCPCPNCLSGNFLQCFYIGFLGQWNTEEMVINNKTDNPAADIRREHAATIHPQLVEFQQTFRGSFFVAIYENEDLQRPTFAEISPFSKFHAVRVRCIVFPAYVHQPGENADFYCNHNHFSVPNNCCYKHPCNCPGLHTQLVEYFKILVICIHRSTAGNMVSTIACDTSLSSPHFKVFKFKKEYEAQQLTDYKTIEWGCMLLTKFEISFVFNFWFQFCLAKGEGKLLKKPCL